MSIKEEEFRRIVSELRVAIAAVDVVLFSVIENSLHVFLVNVDRPPFYKNTNGLPGGVIGVKENADEAATRHLEIKTYIKDVHVEQLYTFSDPDRDKRSRSISIAYMALVSFEKLSSIGKVEGRWFPVKKLPKLAYDHNEIIKVAQERLEGKLAYTNIATNLLPKQFTLTGLQSIYEIVLGRKLDKRNFRKKILSTGLIKEVGKQRKTMHRPAKLYFFVKKDLMIIPEMKVIL